MRLLHTFASLLLLVAFASPATAQPADRRFTVTVEGSGPDVILIPGLGSSADVWNETAARIRTGHRVHRIQIAGFAGAPAVADDEGPVVAPLAEAIAAYIQDQGLEAPAIVGHSLGGEAALMIAARHPDRVGRVMTVDALPFYLLLFSPSATVETSRPLAESMRDGLLAQTPEQAEASTAVTVANMVGTEAARPAVAAWTNASDRSVLARAAYELLTTDLRPELGRISAPLTVIYAWDPRYGRPVEGIDTVFRSAYAGAPQARFERIDNSFHFIMLDQPEAFADAVARFLAGR